MKASMNAVSVGLPDLEKSNVEALLVGPKVNAMQHELAAWSTQVVDGNRAPLQPFRSTSATSAVAVKLWPQRGREARKISRFREHPEVVTGRQLTMDAVHRSFDRAGFWSPCNMALTRRLGLLLR